ncbi:hypothetical protein Droror1_Dr00005199 [Drosera rotundifolia]
MARALVRHIPRIRNPTPSPAPIAATSVIPSPSPPELLKRVDSSTQLGEIHAHLIKSGLSRDPFVGSKLLNLCAQFGDLGYTLFVFEGIERPDVVCVNAVIKGYSVSLLPEKGLGFWGGVRREGLVSANSFTLTALISCCVKSGCGGAGRACHGLAVKVGVDGLVPVGNSLINMYGCCGLIEMGMRVFDEIRERDVVTWNSMVGAFVKYGNLDGAHNLFDKMPERNVVSWNVLLSGYLEGNIPGCVLKLFREMMWVGFGGNDTTVVCVLSGCARSARIMEGMSVHGYLVRNHWHLSLIINTAIVDMYSRCRKVDIARRVFDGMVARNLVCWNAMILGHCLHGKPQDGLDLVARMMGPTSLDDTTAKHNVANGPIVLPDEITFVGILCACTRAGLLDKGRTYFRQMIDIYAIKPNFAHYWCMANLLASQGLTQEALATVNKMKEHDGGVSSENLLWASLLGSCRFEGDISLGERVARSLIELEPGNIMCYALLLNTYAAAGRWEDVARVKEMVKEKVGPWIPGCSLSDLIEVVHEFKVGESKREGVQIVMMMAKMSQRANVSKAEWPDYYFPQQTGKVDTTRPRLGKYSALAYNMSQTLYDYVTGFELQDHRHKKG